jgi:thioesterase domain-containing protein
MKTAGAIERVLAPKVRGALLLDELLRHIPLDFFVLFSSTSSILGPVGQMDYAAANAFLDAFAHHKRAENSQMMTVNWGMWQEVGMAVYAAQQQAKRRTGEFAVTRIGPHPLLEFLASDTDDEITYTSRYSTDQHWILDQHRLKDGTALLPGTGYLEIARAAVGDRHVDRVVEISNLTFINPLRVTDGEQREVRIRLSRNGRGYQLGVTSRPGVDGEWLDHAEGKVSFADKPALAEPYPLEAVLARCSQQRISYAPGEQFTQQEEHLLFGPRWKVLRDVYFGQREALALLALPEDFAGDLEMYQVHPALLDLATGFGLPLTEGYDQFPSLYVPFSYGRVCILHPLPGRLYSHARYKGQQNETTAFDITLIDEDGRVLVEIEDFMMKRVHNPQSLQAGKPRRHADSSAPERPSLLDIGLSEGIRPAEGVQVLERILSSDYAPQVVATSLSLDALAGLISRNVDVQSEGMKFTRPAVGTEYLEPRDELEATLVRIWENALGIAPVGVHDNFFELGGQSLIAIRLLSQFRKELGVDLPMVTFFEAPTAAQCAERIRAEMGDAQTSTKTEQRKKRSKQLSSLVAIQPNGTKLPFFCVHGAGANVMVFSVLSDYLGLDQPFYGLQAQGVDGRSKPLDRIEDMAALYIKEIREIYPRGPYLLGGFSMGGEVAFEMAQQLVAAGEEVPLLALFDTLNPVRSIRMRSTSSAAVTDDNPPGKITAISRKIMGHVRRLAKLTPRQQVDYLSQDARRRLSRLRLRLAVRIAKARGKALPFKLIEQQLWETNLKAVVNYMPRVYPGRITLFRASENLDTNRVDDPMGWGPLAAGGVEEYIIEGTHRLVDEPYVVDVVRQLRICLDNAQQQAEFSPAHGEMVGEAAPALSRE